MKHLLNYELLKDWGFEWCTKERDGGDEKNAVATGYVALTKHTDMFLGEPISLSAYPNDNVVQIWILSVLSDPPRTLFCGIIKNKSALKVILESTIIFKPPKR